MNEVCGILVLVVQTPKKARAAIFEPNVHSFLTKGLYYELST